MTPINREHDMLIDDHIVAVRMQFTGESLAETRRRMHALPDWSAPVPAAANSVQERLESHLLQAMGAAPGSYPLGITEIVPSPSLLELRLESTDLVSAVLPLLPYRDRRGKRHGVVDLRAVPRNREITLLLGRDALGRALLAGSQKGSDLTAVLAEHQAAVEARGHVPLWTPETPHEPLPPLLRMTPRTRPTRIPMRDIHATSPGMPSALLRRLHVWGRPAGSQISVVNSAPAEGTGLTWTVERRVPAGCDLHDDDVVVALEDPVAGPGLPVDGAGHRCGSHECVQTFAEGRLTVRTRRGEGRVSASWPRRGRLDVAIAHEHQAKALRPSERPCGHVLQLLGVFGDDRDLNHAAEQLSAAWAAEGRRVLVLNVESSSRRRPTPWRRARLTLGPGVMFRGVVELDQDLMTAALDRAREEFDHVILFRAPSLGEPAWAFQPLADDHVVVADGHFPTATGSAAVHGGELRRRTVELSPAESAMAWMHSQLARLPFADLPISGLLLLCPLEEHLADSFDSLVDAELARHGMPVLGRLPAPGRRSPWPTVLDHLPEEHRALVMAQGTQIREGLGPAGRDQAVLLDALDALWSR